MAAQSYFNELFSSAEFYKREINVYKEDVPRFVRNAVASFEAGAKRTFRSSTHPDITIDFDGPPTVAIDSLRIDHGKVTISRLVSCCLYQ